MTPQTNQAELLRDAGDALGKYYMHLKTLRRNPITSDKIPSPDQCAAAIAAWKARGVKDADPIESFDLNDHPKSKQNKIPLAEMESVCAEYRKLYPRYKIAYDLRQADGILMRIREGFVKPDDSMVSSHMIEEYERGGDPAACQASLAAARALDPAMKVGNKGLTLDQYQTQVLEPLSTAVPQWVAAARAALRARNAKAAAPFVAAGISAQKLDLMVQYEGVYWRLPGGERTDDAKKLAAASVLFQWLEAEDRVDPRYVLHTIRRYQFKGNDLDKVTETQHRIVKGGKLGDVFQ
jgi:hypothetical protein